MRADFKVDGRAITVTMKDMTPGQFMAFHRALKLYAETSPVAAQVLEEIDDGAPESLLEKV